MSFENNSAGFSNTEDGMSGGPRNVQQQAAQKRMQQTQAQVDEVVGIMRVNVEKVLERDQKLSELDNRADALQQGAAQFEQQANKLKRKYWWKNLKMMIIMGVIVAVLIIIIVLVIKFSGEESSSSSGNNGNPVADAPAGGNPAGGNPAGGNPAGGNPTAATISPASK